MTKGSMASSLMEMPGRSNPARKSRAVQRTIELSALNRLRCHLRAVNIEYSALVRGKADETACTRMAEIRAERHVLIRLIATRCAYLSKCPLKPRF